MKVVLDTNVLVAALKSSLGASFRLILLVKAGHVKPAVTTPLLVEYESVLGIVVLTPGQFLKHLQL